MKCTLSYPPQLVLLCFLGLTGCFMGSNPTLQGLEGTLQTFQGQQQKANMARTQIQSAISNLQGLMGRLRLVISPQQGDQIYQALNNAMSQLSGGGTTPPIQTSNITVQVVERQIADLINMLQYLSQQTNSMTVKQIDEILPKLNTVQSSIAGIGV